MGLYRGTIREPGFPMISIFFHHHHYQISIVFFLYLLISIVFLPNRLFFRIRQAKPRAKGQTQAKKVKYRPKRPNSGQKAKLK